MNKILGAAVLLVLTSSFTVNACDPLSAAEQIADSETAKRLLEKASIRMNADCKIAVESDEYYDPGVEVNYSRGDETRRNGTVNRTFTGKVHCFKDGSTLKKYIRGSTTIKFSYYRGDDSCDDTVFEEVTSIKAKMKY